MKLTEVLLLIIITIYAFGGLSAVAAPVVASPKNQLESPSLKQSKHLSIALANNIKPYQFYEDNRQQGYITDWWRLWGEINDYHVTITMTTWQNSIDLMEQGKVDLHGGLQNLPSRATKFSFSQPIVNIQSQLFLTRDVVSNNLINTLFPYVVGIIEGSAMIDMLAQRYPQFKVTIYPNRQSLLRAVRLGEVKVVAGISTTTLAAPDLASLFPPTKRIQLFNHPISAAALNTNIELINIVEQGRNKIPAGALRQLARKWFSTKKNNARLMLTTPLDYAPFASISLDGQPYGYLIDLWDLWSKKTKTSIDFMPSYRTDMLKNVRSGAADLTLSYPEHQLTNGLIKGRKMTSVDVGIYYYTEKFKHLNIEDLAGRKIGYDSAVFGHQELKKLQIQAPNSVFMPLNSINELINAVRGGDVSAIMMTSYFGRATLSYLHLSHQFRRVENFNYDLDIYIWTNKKSAALLPGIARGFEAISDVEINRLALKWFSKLDTQPKRILGEISPLENAWIKRHPEIKFGYVTSRIPFELTNQQHKMDGINRTILDLIASKTSLNFTYHPYTTVAQLQSAINNNEVDVISSVYEKLTNWHYLNLTQPYWDSSIAAISSENTTFESLNAMHGKTIALNINSSYREHLLTILPDASLIDVDSVAGGIAAVASGKAQIYIGNILMAAQEIRENTYSNFTINIIDSLQLANPRFVVRSDWQPLVKIMDKAVLKISGNERLILFEQWLKHSLAEEGKYRELLKLTIPMLILAMMGFCCFIYWNNRLRGEVKQRLALQKKFEHQAKHDELTGIPNRASLKEKIKAMLTEHHLRGDRLLCLFIDLNGFKSINDTYGHDVGDILLVQFCRRLTNHLRHGDFVSRFGGDEFVILASLKDPQLGSEAITKMVHSLYRDPIMIEHLEIYISCSIGGAIFPQDGTTFDQLIKKADQRMYREKHRKGYDNVTKVRFRRGG